MPVFFKELLAGSNPKPNCFQDSMMDHFLAYFLFSDCVLSFLVPFQRAKCAYKRDGGIWLSLEMPIRVLKFFLRKKKGVILEPQT